MKIWFKKIFIILILGTALLWPGFAAAETYGAGNPVDIYFFKNFGCPHCADEEPFLQALADKYDNINLFEFELSGNKENQTLLADVSRELKANFTGVPITIVGSDFINGWLNAQTTGRSVEAMIEKYAGKRYYNDSVKKLLNPDQVEEGTAVEPEEKNPGAPDENRTLPVLGEVNLKQLSLPLLAVSLGFVDGFNPCAMWVLIFLITLLLGMKDRKRMWFLGSLFIFISALSYFVFMAAWLNLLLFIGLVFWIRLVIALVALIFGAINLKDYFTKKEDECVVSDLAERRKITDRLKEVVYKRNFWIASGGIILLGFSVNLVELLCSAGFPAVFTEVLALSGVSPAAYYGYITLYILFYMLDDLVVFFLAMFTLRATGLSTKYLRLTKLVGGVLMIIIGLLLILKPGWLMFG